MGWERQMNQPGEGGGVLVLFFYGVGVLYEYCLGVDRTGG